jgi:hypothetical protein
LKIRAWKPKGDKDKPPTLWQVLVHSNYYAQFCYRSISFNSNDSTDFNKFCGWKWQADEFDLEKINKFLFHV